MCVCMCVRLFSVFGFATPAYEDTAWFTFLRLKPLKGHIQRAAVRRNTKICELLMNFAPERRQSMALVLGVSLLFII